MTRKVDHAIVAAFEAHERAEVTQLLDGLALPSRENWERVCLAIVWLSDGKIATAREYVGRAMLDWETVAVRGEQADDPQF